MSDFELRNKIESWVEGILDVIQMYLVMVLQINLRFLKSINLFKSEDDISNFSRP